MFDATISAAKWKDMRVPGLRGGLIRESTAIYYCLLNQGIHAGQCFPGCSMKNRQISPSPDRLPLCFIVASEILLSAFRKFSWCSAFATGERMP